MTSVPSAILVTLTLVSIAIKPTNNGSFALPASKIYNKISPLSLTRLNTKTRSQDEKCTIPPPAGSLGPRGPELKSLLIGQQPLCARRRKPCLPKQEGNDDDQDQDIWHEYTIERVSMTPDIFLLRGFLPPNECQNLIEFAESKCLDHRPGVGDISTPNDATLSAQSRKRCSVGWLGHTDANGIPGELASAAARLLLSDDFLTSFGAGCEDMQIVKYEAPGGEFVLHHDGSKRCLTVLYYLNGVGGTWFPLADAADSSRMPNMPRNVPRNRNTALEMASCLKPGKDGLLVQGKERNSGLSSTSTGNVVYVGQGDAIAFYNHWDNETGEMNWTALHAGLPTTLDGGTKWIGNHWFNPGELIE